MKVKKFSFDKRFFNKLFFKIYNAQTKEHKRFIVNYGGAGSGKSYSQVQYEIISLLTNITTLLVVRKFAVTLKDSVIAQFVQQLNNWEIPFIQNKTNRTITLLNGSTIHFKGVDDGANKLKSFVFSGIAKIWIEEANELLYEDFKQINLRMRGPEAQKGIISLTFNPTSKKNWVYKHFFLNRQREDTYYFKTTYKDNSFIDSAYIEQLEEYKEFDEIMYQIYCLGEFGTIRTGSECYKNFDQIKNSELLKQNKCEYDPTKPIFLSFDENLHPHVSVVFAQFESEDQTLNIIQDFGERGLNLEDTIFRLSTKLKDHKSFIYILGDPSSNKGDVKLEKGINFFMLIKNFFKQYGIETIIKTDVRAENVYTRILFFNKKINEGKIVINNNCSRLIQDLEEVVWDQNGTNKNKQYVTVKIGEEKIREQKNGHFSDCLDYLYSYIFKIEMQNFKRRDTVNKVLTSSKFENMGY